MAARRPRRSTSRRRVRDRSNIPHGYKRIVPLEKTFRLRLPETGEAPGFCRDLHAVPISASEFATAMRDYPIVFVCAGEFEFSSMAILGMHTRQNLFVDGDGRWDRRTYMPAYVRRYPFCLIAADEAAVGDAQRMVCVDPDAIDDKGGRRMFDEEGEALPHWNIIERMLHEYEDDLALSRDMCRLFARCLFSSRSPCARSWWADSRCRWRTCSASTATAFPIRSRGLARAADQGLSGSHLRASVLARELPAAARPPQLLRRRTAVQSQSVQLRPA